MRFGFGKEETFFGIAFNLGYSYEEKAIIFTLQLGSYLLILGFNV